MQVSRVAKYAKMELQAQNITSSSLRLFVETEGLFGPCLHLRTPPNDGENKEATDDCKENT